MIGLVVWITDGAGGSKANYGGRLGGCRHP